MRSQYESGVSYLSNRVTKRSQGSGRHLARSGCYSSIAEQRADQRSREKRMYHQRSIGGKRRGLVCPVLSGARGATR